TRACRPAVAVLGTLRRARLAGTSARSARRQGRRAGRVRPRAHRVATIWLDQIRADAGARQMTGPVPQTYDLVAPFPGRPIALRVQWITTWFAGWTALVLVMAGVVSTQKGVPFVYTLRSEAINYYTLAAVSIVVWLASAR